MSFRAAKAFLARKPTVAQCVMTATLFATGDVVNQQLVERKGVGKHDFKSTARMGFYGGFVFGPACTAWYRVLDQKIVFKNPILRTGGRVAADQLIFAPCGLGVFFYTMGLLKGESPTAAVREKWWPTLVTNWYCWPAIQIANFSVVPLQYRLLVVNTLSIGWNAYLANVNKADGGSTMDTEAKITTPTI